MTKLTLSDFLKARVRTIRGWPKDGINFRDVTTLFHDPEAFRVMVEAFAIDAASATVSPRSPARMPSAKSSRGEAPADSEAAR